MNAFKNGAKNEVHTFGYPCPFIIGDSSYTKWEVELENLKVSLWPEYDQDCRGRKKPAGAKTAKKKAPFKKESFCTYCGASMPVNAGFCS